MPNVFIGFELRIGTLAGQPSEQDVVAGLAVERRVETDEIDAGIADLVAQHVEVVAIIKCVGHGRVVSFNALDFSPLCPWSREVG
jgi:hypothetical protein